MQSERKPRNRPNAVDELSDLPAPSILPECGIAMPQQQTCDEYFEQHTHRLKPEESSNADPNATDAHGGVQGLRRHQTHVHHAAEKEGHYCQDSVSCQATRLQLQGISECIPWR